MNIQRQNHILYLTSFYWLDSLYTSSVPAEMNTRSVIKAVINMEVSEFIIVEIEAFTLGILIHFPVTTSSGSVYH